MDGLGKIATLSMEGDRELTLLLEDEGDQTRPQVSPDGRWMAYMSDESGRFEIYIRPFPDVNNGKWQVSRGGGTEPIWSRDGSELFYRSGDAIMVVSVKTEPSISLETPKMLFRGERVYISNAFFTYWDIHPDGNRFLMIKDPISGVPREGRSGRTINIVLNWFEELKQRVPVE